MEAQAHPLKRSVLFLATLAIAAGIVGTTCPRAWGKGSLPPPPPPPKSITELKKGGAAPAVGGLRTQDDRLVDAEGRQVTLRGFVIPARNVDGSPVALGDADYQRMRALGADYQVVCVGLASLGLYPALKPDPDPMGRLAARVAAGRRVGMYTVVRLTASDIPEDAQATFWSALWQNQGGTQGGVVNAWRRIWAMLRDEPTVLGYDLIDAPTPGRLSVTEAEFAQRFLLPFYLGGIDALRQQDSTHLVLIQPPVRTKYLEYAPWAWTVDRPNVVLSPGCYPNLAEYVKKLDLSTTGYDAAMRRVAEEGRRFKMPVMLSGYGMPYPPERDADESFSRLYAELEKGLTNFEDSHDLSAARPWYSDDRAYALVGGKRLSWSVLKGQGTAAGAGERAVILDVFARPRPRRLSGSQPYYGYDAPNRRFVIRYVARAGVTEIFVPRARLYREGFGVGLGTGLLMLWDPKQPKGLRPADPARAAEAAACEWDEASQTLRIRETAPGTRASIGVFPPPKPE